VLIMAASLKRLVNVKSNSRGMLIICTASQFVSQTTRLFDYVGFPLFDVYLAYIMYHM